MGKRPKNNFYVYVTKGDQGIVSSWPACERKVMGIKGARYRGFPDRASAVEWLEAGASYSSKKDGTPPKFYAYHTETEDGIVGSWTECEQKIEGHKARYRSFPDRPSARKWLDGGARYEDRKAAKAEALRAFPDEAIFFDSGTGPGRGVELKVTDRDAAPMVHLAGDLPDGTSLTKEGSLVLGPGRTNNYGELLACFLAIRVAEQVGSKCVYGDSKLVLDYWSKWHISKEKRLTDPELVELARETSRARTRFERHKGELGHISGGLNPADLGFHRD